jgi:hypothetical protein
MAELLIKAIDMTHPDPEKDKGCYKRGDIVDVRPDGHPWGKEEGPPKFYIVKVPDAKPEDIKHLQESETETKNKQDKDGKDVLDKDGNPIEQQVMTKRRRYNLDIDSMETPDQESLASGIKVELAMEKLNPVVLNKTTSTMLSGKAKVVKEVK